MILEFKIFIKIYFHFFFQKIQFILFYMIKEIQFILFYMIKEIQFILFYMIKEKEKIKKLINGLKILKVEIK
jgi:hypothetical protein